MNKHWQIFKKGQPTGDYLKALPEAPPWRRFKGIPDPDYKPVTESAELANRGAGFQTDAKGQIERMVNAALCLRRPLLITGDPGTGKSSLIYAVAYQLQLGPILKWPITSRSTLAQGLYQYDAIGRLQAGQMKVLEAELKKLRQQELDAKSIAPPDIGKYIKLGPLGTALLPTTKPRALLIDEIDKSDLDLPNDLLHVFEEGEFSIPELERMEESPVTVRDWQGHSVKIERGRVRCREFPFIIMTSNGEREFPAPFLRRCLRLDMPKPNEKILTDIVAARLENPSFAKKSSKLIGEFFKRRESKALATDQLLNAVYLLKGEFGVTPSEQDKLLKALLRELSGSSLELSEE